VGPRRKAGVLMALTWGLAALIVVAITWPRWLRRHPPLRRIPGGWARRLRRLNVETSAASAPLSSADRWRMMRLPTGPAGSAPRWSVRIVVPHHGTRIRCIHVYWEAQP
jgi:hypothetical protein